MALIYTDTNLVEQGYLSGAVMDLQEEEKENTFTLEMGLEDYSKITAGCYVYDEHNPQFGGMVRNVKIHTAQNSLIWGGVTFAGILSYKIIEPEPNKAYREVTGTLPEKIKAIINTIGLADVFFTDVSGTESSTWQLPRYIDALRALRRLANQYGLLMKVSFDKFNDGPKLKISFETPRTVTAAKEYDSDQFDFDIEKDLKPVNHLICLGRGQLTNRWIYHLYVDGQGIISDMTKTFTGKDEIVAVYENSNVETYDELKSEGERRLRELLASGTKLEITPPDNYILNIGDVIAGREKISGIYVEKEIKKIIYKAQDDLPPTITYDTSSTKG